MKSFYFKAVRDTARKYLDYAIDTIAPPHPTIREIERLGSAGFLRVARLLDKSDELEGVTSFFSYKDDIVRTALLEVKSYGNRKIAGVLGEALYECLAVELFEKHAFENFENPLIAVIPMTRKCLRKRGWNQCELILEGVRNAAEKESLETRADALVKTKETKDQVGRSRAERFENLRDCFAVKDPDAVKGRNVIVIDDIATTGATLGEARRALKKAGAKRVWCVALAH